MSKIILGKSQEGKVVEIDLKVLLRTRFLVQAASGGGKSRTLRRLAEQFFGKVPVWIIDKEDEFPSLRDKFGYIFSGPGGETPTDPRSAELVCERLLKAKASAIFGLYSLKDPVRHEWVKIFLNALMNAPKSLWTNLVVMVDEAHKFMPEKGQGESVAREAMTDLAVDGRKRGFCPGYYTQRLGKLSKNGSAELLNRVIGKTLEDIDVDRAVDLMSVRRTEREEFEHGIKRLQPGQFWCFGDAISLDRILVQVGDVQTKHPEPGAPAAAAPPPLPEKMKAILPQLADLPKEAETKARTEKELRTENISLRAEIVRLKKQATIPQKTAPVQAPVTKEVKVKVEVPVIREAELKRLERLGNKLSDLGAHLTKHLHATSEQVLALATKKAEKLSLSERKFPALQDKQIRQAHDAFAGRKTPALRVVSAPPVRKPQSVAEVAGEEPLSDLQLRQLTGLSDFERIGIQKVHRRWLSGWLGMKLSGHFKNEFGKSRKHGLIEYDGLLLFLTEEGRAIAPPSELEMSNKTVLERCASAVSDLSARQLRRIYAAYPEWMGREDLATDLGMSLSGHFKNEFGKLHKAGMVDYGTGENKNMLRCAEWLFVEGVPAAI